MLFFSVTFLTVICLPSMVIYGWEINTIGITNSSLQNGQVSTKILSLFVPHLNYLYRFVDSYNLTITEPMWGPKKLNSDVPSYIWTLEPCRLDCSSRKVKRSGYLLVFIFGRHAKLSQCFFYFWGWQNFFKENHYTQNMYTSGEIFSLGFHFQTRGAIY